ncbi:MAG TPA: chloride channel protein [Polyangia bacterium]|nr:chloride channel protein [Polyangia bacterium]
MADHHDDGSSISGALPVAPSLGPALDAAQMPVEVRPVDKRVAWICGLAILVAVAAGFVAQLLVRMIGFFTNLAFFGRISTSFVSPADNHLGHGVIVVPVIGGVMVGLMARYGSKAIRGHGIPEAMEQVLTNQSRIPWRMTFLKPLSAAIAIGTGGPFGAEGPIIATGGALGSLVGQIVRTTAAERKTLLAAGAAAGMAATFGSPVSAVLLAVELLLFELRARSLIPVALAAATATAVRIAWAGTAPSFEAGDFLSANATGLTAYALIGALVGVASVGVTKLVYAIEDGFEKLPIHWMWWPALGGLVVGVCGLFAPHTLGVGYDNIDHILSGRLTLTAIAVLCLWKFVSWAFSLGSGTSGGTLAPLFTIGGGAGALLGAAFVLLAPHAGIDVRLAALVGMASMFAGASRAVLASIVFAFETTRQPIALLPLLAGGITAHFLSSLLMRNSIMTEKIARRGVRVSGDYAADALDQVRVRDAASRAPVTLTAARMIDEVRAWLASGAPEAEHQGFPIVDGAGHVVGLLTRRDLLHPAAQGSLGGLIKRSPVVVPADHSLRQALDQMVRAEVGRLVVVETANPRVPVGVLTRSDLLGAHAGDRDDAVVAAPLRSFGKRTSVPARSVHRSGG